MLLTLKCHRWGLLFFNLLLVIISPGANAQAEAEAVASAGGASAVADAGAFGGGFPGGAFPGGGFPGGFGGFSGGQQFGFGQGGAPLLPGGPLLGGPLLGPGGANTGAQAVADASATAGGSRWGGLGGPLLGNGGGNAGAQSVATANANAGGSRWGGGNRGGWPVFNLGSGPLLPQNQATAGATAVAGGGQPAPPPLLPVLQPNNGPGIINSLPQNTNFANFFQNAFQGLNQGGSEVSASSSSSAVSSGSEASAVSAAEADSSSSSSSATSVSSSSTSFVAPPPLQPPAQRRPFGFSFPGRSRIDQNSQATAVATADASAQTGPNIQPGPGQPIPPWIVGPGGPIWQQPGPGGPIVQPGPGGPIVQPGPGGPIVQPGPGGPIVQPGPGGPILPPRPGGPNRPPWIFPPRPVGPVGPVGPIGPGGPDKPVWPVGPWGPKPVGPKPPLFPIGPGPGPGGPTDWHGLFGKFHIFLKDWAGKKDKDGWIDFFKNPFGGLGGFFLDLSGFDLGDDDWGKFFKFGSGCLGALLKAKEAHFHKQDTGPFLDMYHSFLPNWIGALHNIKVSHHAKLSGFLGPFLDHFHGILAGFPDHMHAFWGKLHDHLGAKFAFMKDFLHSHHLLK